MGPLLKSEPKLGADEFLLWYDAQPDGQRYELLDGQIFTMQAERAAHGRAKARIDRMFARQIAEQGLTCEAFADGMAVKVDDLVVFEPDALVRCGANLPDAATFVTDPIIVVEVASPSTQRIDALTKYTKYFRNPHIIHYLIVIPSEKAVIHHQRVASGEIVGRNYRGGIIRFDPPGIELNLDEVLA